MIALSNRLKTLFGRRIYKSPSGLCVYQNPWYRWLTFGNDTLQTLLNRHHPERGGLHYIYPITQFAFAFPGHCCILGLGGAGIAHALYPALAAYDIDAVEKSQEVIDIATRYFNIERLTNLTIHTQDAVEFVRRTDTIYQHLFIDLHNGEDYPEACSSVSFFSDCKHLLALNGIIAINLIHIQDKLALFQRIREHFNDCTLTVPVKGTGNTIVFAFHVPSPKVFMEITQIKSMIHSLTWTETWGYLAQFY